MKIELSDGRVLEGTALQIVRAMQSVSFAHRDSSLREYVAWSVANARRLNELELDVAGESDDQLAESLVRAMCAKKLATAL